MKETLPKGWLFFFKLFFSLLSPCTSVCINTGTCVCRCAHYRCVLCLTLLSLFNPLKLLLSAPGTPIEVKLGAEETAGSAGWETAQHCTFTAETGWQKPKPHSHSGPRNPGQIYKSKVVFQGAKPLLLPEEVSYKGCRCK